MRDRQRCEGPALWPALRVPAVLNAPPPLSLTRGALRRGSWQTGGTGGHGFMKAPWPPLVEVAFWFVPLIGPL